MNEQAKCPKCQLTVGIREPSIRMADSQWRFRHHNNRNKERCPASGQAVPSEQAPK